MTRIVFLDTETTGLDTRRALPWECAWIIRDPGEPDRERHAFVAVSLADAEPKALEVGRYYQRHPRPYLVWPEDAGLDDYLAGVIAPAELASTLAADLRDAVMVGFNPAYDAAILERFMRSHELAPTWHYRTVDATTMAGTRSNLPVPWSTNDLLHMYDVIVPPGDRHTAMGDARATRDLYDAVTTRARV